MQMVLARMRQLSAHEVGHTLGLEHNFAASTVNRASVMDYPPPVVTLGADGVPDLSNAYAVGIGEWDKVSIAYGYTISLPGTDEKAALNKIMNDAYSRGQRFLTDQDARPASAASPYAHLWDAGPNAVDELNRIMKVRAAVLARFGENNIREGEPMATLEDRLVLAYYAASLSSGSGGESGRRGGLHFCGARGRAHADETRARSGATARAGRSVGDVARRTRSGLPHSLAADDSAAPAGLSADARAFPPAHRANL